MITRARGGAWVVFTDRRGGVSTGPYASANLAEHVGDDPAAVTENRGRAAAEAGLPGPERWVVLAQVHGPEVVGVEEPLRPAPRADAAATATVGLPLVVLVADCAPLALVAPRAVAAVHVGWRGLEQGVVQQAVTALRELSGGPVHAVLGPCIRPARYAFGPDILSRLVARYGDGVAAWTDDGAPALDIPAAVRTALGEAGVDDLEDVGVCTAASPDHFSFRRDGETGRQAMIVVRGR